MYVMIDNYDSYVYNLVGLFHKLGCKMEVFLNEEESLAAIEKKVSLGEVEAFVISPGPGRPQEAGIAGRVVCNYAGMIPIFGICLGHQIIANEFGAHVVKGKRPMHGKLSEITHSETGIFEEITRPFQVMRYHSLEVLDKELPEEFRVDARSKDQVIMAISHKKYPLFGVQFHPESFLTEFGETMILNFMKICEQFWEQFDGTK